MGAQCESVQISHHFRNRIGRDVADDIGLCHRTGNHSGQVPALVAAAVVYADILSRLVSGGMLKLYVREPCRDFDHAVHIAETGGKDQVVALGRVTLQHTRRVRPFRDQFAVCCLHAQLFQCQPALIVCIAPTEISDRANVDKCNLYRFNRTSGSCRLFSGRHFADLLTSAHQQCQKQQSPNQLLPMSNPHVTIPPFTSISNGLNPSCCQVTR